MQYEATGRNFCGETKIESLKLSGDDDFLTDLFMILGNKIGDIQYGGEPMESSRQLKHAIDLIKAGKYGDVLRQLIKTELQPDPEDIIEGTYICPKCHGKSNGTICKQCRNEEVETRQMQEPRLYEPERVNTYTHVCRNCHCQCVISGAGPTYRDCPECKTPDMIRTKDAKL